MLGGSSKGWTISIKRHIAIIWVWDMSPDFILKLSGVVNVAVIFDWKKYHDYDFKWLSCLNQWQILNEGFVFIIYCILITNQDQYIFFLILIKKSRMTLSMLEACRQSCGTKTHVGNALSRIHHHCSYKWKKTHLTPKDAWLKRAFERSYYTADISDNKIALVLSDTCNVECSVLLKVRLSRGGWMMDSGRLFARRHNSKFNCGPSK